MTKNSDAVVLPFTGVRKSTQPSAPNGPFFSVVVQDDFSSNSDREEFRQAITSYGITFLRCSDAPLPPPSENDLKILKKLARVLSKVWSHQQAVLP
jgi:hypothetical protein